jgi:hypothetical protein
VSRENIQSFASPLADAAAAGVSVKICESRHGDRSRARPFVPLLHSQPLPPLCKTSAAEAPAPAPSKVSEAFCSLPKRHGVARETDLSRVSGIALTCWRQKKNGGRRYSRRAAGPAFWIDSTPVCQRSCWIRRRGSDRHEQASADTWRHCFVRPLK